MSKKLYRSTHNEKISGVCAGIAEYFNIDATVVRLLWAIITVFTGFLPGIILYVACAVIMPAEPQERG